MGSVGRDAAKEQLATERPSWKLKRTLRYHNSASFSLNAISLASRAATSPARPPVEATAARSLRPGASIIARRAIITITAFSIKIRLPLFSFAFFTGFSPLVSEDRFARESNLARRIDVDHLHQQLLAFSQFIANVAHSIVGNFGDV